MSDIIHVTPGDKVKRGALVISGAADLEIKVGKKAPTKLKAYWCPKGCTRTIGGGKPKRPLLWANTPEAYEYAELTPCADCGTSLVPKPKGRKSTEE